MKVRSSLKGREKAMWEVRTVHKLYRVPQALNGIGVGAVIVHQYLFHILSLRSAALVLNPLHHFIASEAHKALCLVTGPWQQNNQLESVAARLQYQWLSVDSVPIQDWASSIQPNV
jgi:hypothetical protein